MSNPNASLDGVLDQINADPVGANAVLSPMAQMPVEVSNWLAGVVELPPDQVQNVLQDINFKMIYMQAYTHVLQMCRLAPMFNTVKWVQDKLGNKAALETMTTKELVSLHKRLTDDIDKVLASTRKFLSQNDEILQRAGKSKKEFIDILRNIDPAILQRVSDAFRGK